MQVRDDRLLGLAIGGLLATAVSQGIGRFVYTPILPVMMAQIGLSGSAGGLVASANFVGYLLGALTTSLPNLPGSRRLWMLGGLVASTLTTGLSGLCTDPVALGLVRLVGGFASAIVLVYASALVLDRLNAARQGHLSAVHFAGIGVGICASSILVSGLLGAGFGWRELWYAAALVSAVSLAFAAWLIPPGPSLALTAESLGGGRVATAPGGLARLVAAYGLFGFGYVITATFLIAIVRANPDTSGLTPWIWLMTGLAGVPSVAFWNRVTRRIGIYRAFALASLAEAIGVAASVVWSGPPGVILAAILLGGTFIGMSAMGLMGARNLSGSDPRRVMGMMTASFGLGQIVGPAVAGIAFDLTGTFVLPSLAAVASLAVAALLVWGIRPPPPAAA